MPYPCRHTHIRSNVGKQLWILTHSLSGRNWQRFQVHDEHAQVHDAWVLAEWHGDPSDDGVARLPDHAVSNTDPLVVGRHFFWDYCRRGQGAGKPIKSTMNSFAPGDTILFGSHNKALGGLVVDTVFVVGETRPWPTSSDEIPAWSDLDDVALQTHFQRIAHRHDHPEVHVLVRCQPVQSYRSRRRADAGSGVGEPGDGYSWVPFATSRRDTPFVLRPDSRAHGLITSVFPERPLASYASGSFPVTTVADDVAADLHGTLRDEARSQGFGIGVEVQLIRAQQTV